MTTTTQAGFAAEAADPPEETRLQRKRRLEREEQMGPGIEAICGVPRCVGDAHAVVELTALLPITVGIVYPDAVRRPLCDEHRDRLLAILRAPAR